MPLFPLLLLVVVFVHRAPEKGTLIVKKIKSVPKDLILDKLLQLLDQMAEKPESVEKVAITRWS
jgi:site-specific recombinase XerC